MGTHAVDARHRSRVIRDDPDRGRSPAGGHSTGAPTANIQYSFVMPKRLSSAQS